MTHRFLMLLVTLSLVSFCGVSASAPQTKVITGDYGMSLFQRRLGTTIEEDYGGYILQYIAMYKDEAKKGTSYIIDGPCASACTMILGIIPRERVCVTSEATLGFHSGYIWWFGKWHNVAATKLMWSYYPRTVRRALIKHYGWNGGKGEEHLEMMWFEASMFYDECNTPMLKTLHAIGRRVN